MKKKKRWIKQLIKTSIKVLINKVSPISLNIDITNNCNSRCHYCYYWKRKTKDMSFELYKRIIDEAYDIGIVSVSISGGEPLLRKDIAKILNYAHNKGLYVTLLTNGLLLKKKFNDIKDYVDLFGVSLDTLKPKQYEKIRGVKGGLKLVLEGIQTVIKGGRRLTITCVVSKDNYKEIEDIVNFAEKNNINIGLPPIHNYKGRHIQKGSNNKIINNTYKRILELKKQGKPVFYSTKYLKSLIHDKNIICRRLFLTLFVNATGHLEVECPLVNGEQDLIEMNTNKKYSLKNHSLKELLYSKDADRARKFASKCYLCNHACIMEPSLIANKDLSVIKKYLTLAIKQIINKKS